MEKLFKWLVILALSLLTVNVLIVEGGKDVEQVSLSKTIYETKEETYAIDNDGNSYEMSETEVEVVLPKKVTPPKKLNTTPPKNQPMFINSSLTHSSWKEEADAQPDFGTREVQELIRHYSNKYGYDAELALRISGCESGYRAKVKNNVSSAGGPFQFINSTRNSSSHVYGRGGESRFNADANVDIAIQKLKNEGTSARNASRHCWHR